MASEAELTLMIGRMGPKISSCMTESSGDTFDKMVKSMYNEDLSCSPPINKGRARWEKMKLISSMMRPRKIEPNMDKS